MKIDCGFEVVPVAEATRHILDRLNRRVQSLAGGVGYPVLKEGHDVLQILAEHPSYGLDGLQAGPDGPTVPALKMLLGPGWGMISCLRIDLSW